MGRSGYRSYGGSLYNFDLRSHSSCSRGSRSRAAEKVKKPSVKKSEALIKKKEERNNEVKPNIFGFSMDFRYKIPEHFINTEMLPDIPKRTKAASPQKLRNS